MLNDDMKRIGNIRQNLNADLSIYIDKYPGFLKHLGQSRISLIADIEPASRQVRYLSAIVSQHITRDIYLTGNYTIYPDTRVSQFSLSLNCNLPMFRNQTTANQYQGRSMAYSTAFSGSVEFDSYNMRLSMLNSMGSTNNFGRSSAAVQFYNDRNYNNEFDEGDKAINEVDFFVSNSTTQKTNVGNYKILSNLIPNKRYNIRVKPESFSNPSLIPQYTEFSFVTEPYSYKAINIPCHMGGMLEGIVKKLIPNGESVGQGGLKLHIVSKSSDFTTVVKVFSDGSFFYNGLPVGDYEIFIDDKQLEILSCTSEPQTIAFTVKPMSDGDYIDNLNFQIKPTVDKLEIQSSN